MPYLLEDLVIDRVDLVDEGANSAAFIELYKRKEPSVTMGIEEIVKKMKPEHAQVIQDEIDRINGELAKANTTITAITSERDTATDDLKKAKSDLDEAQKVIKSKTPCSCDGEEDEKGMCKVCGKPKKSIDETETLKAMPEAARALYIKMRDQKNAAEEQIRKAKEAEKNAEAVAKAASLKSLPVEEAKLVEVLKSCNTEMVDMLTAINAAINGTVLAEVGKNHTGSTGADAWSKIESKATEVAKRDTISKQKAIAVVIKENPELYKEYLQGGAN